MQRLQVLKKDTSVYSEQKTFSSGSFTKLSDSLMFILLRYLEFHEVFRFAETCSRLASVCADERLWRQRLDDVGALTIKKASIVPAIHDEKGAVVAAEKPLPALQAKTYKEYEFHMRRVNFFLREIGLHPEDYLHIPSATRAAVTSVVTPRIEDFKSLLHVRNSFPNAKLTGSTFYVKGGQMLTLLHQTKALVHCSSFNEDLARSNLQSCLTLYAQTTVDLSDNDADNFNEYLSSVIVSLAEAGLKDAAEICRQTLTLQVASLFRELHQQNADLAQLENFSFEKQARILHQSFITQALPNILKTSNLLGQILTELQQRLKDVNVAFIARAEVKVPDAYKEATWRHSISVTNTIAEEILDDLYRLEMIESNAANNVGTALYYGLKLSVTSVDEDIDPRLRDLVIHNLERAKRLNEQWHINSDSNISLNAQFFKRFNEFRDNLTGSLHDETLLKSLITWCKENDAGSIIGIGEARMLREFAEQISTTYPNLSKLYVLETGDDPYLADLLRLKELPRRRWSPLIFRAKYAVVGPIPQIEYDRALAPLEQDPDVRELITAANWQVTCGVGQRAMLVFDDVVNATALRFFAPQTSSRIKYAKELLTIMDDEKQQSRAKALLEKAEAAAGSTCNAMKGYGLKP